MKLCPKCSAEKPETEFHKNRARPDGLTLYCKACVSAYHAEQYRTHAHIRAEIAERQRARKAASPEKAERQRAQAREWQKKNRAQYYARARGWITANPDAARRIGRRGHLKRNYGLTEDGFDALLAWSDGGCAICGATQSKGKRATLHVDHDHVTGAVRGVLCNHCNYGLGHFHDRPDLLRIAIAYLEYFK